MQMILGGRSGELEDDEVADAYPWPDEGPWVRAMMVTTLDGAAAGKDGLSGSISGSADEAVFSAVRRFADAVLVGGGTVKAEGYGALAADPRDADRRTSQGQAPAPTFVVVSGSLDLPLGDDGFAGSAMRPLVLTGSDPDPDRLAAVRERCDVLQAPDERVPADWALDRVLERGLRRIVCEGGPTLLRDVAATGRLDEADLTFGPLMVGTGNTPTTDVLDDPARFDLAHVLTADGFLMARYVRADAR